MKALRQIVEVKGNSLNIQLPEDFNAAKVEIIILPMEEETKKSKRIANLRGKLKLSSDQYKDFQKDVENSREGWGKNI